MARNRYVFFPILQPILNFQFLRRVRLAKPIIALITALVCLIISPVFAKAPAVNSKVQNLTSIQGKTQELVQQGQQLYAAGRFSEAVNVLQQVAVEFRSTGDSLREAMALSNLSLAYQQLGLWEQAEKAVAQSLSLLKYPKQSETGTPGIDIKNQQILLAQALDVQGRLQFSQGQAQAALSTWQESLKIYQQIGERTASISNRINSAQALQVLGLYLQANKVLTEVEQTLKNQPNSLLKAINLRNLGNVLQIVGDLNQSRWVLEESLQLLEKVSSSPQEVSETLFSLGNTARAQQDTQAALTYYQKAASISNTILHIQAQLNQLRVLIETKQFSKASALSSQIQSEIHYLPSSRIAVNAKINFAQSLMKLGSRGRGEEGEGEGEMGRGGDREEYSSLSFEITARMLAQAVQQSQNLQDKRAESYALGTLGELYEKTQQFSEAKKLTQKALLLAQSIDAADIVYQWQWQLGRILKKQGDITAIADYFQAFQTLQSLRKDLVAINPDVQFSFTASVESVHRELVGLLLQNSLEGEPNQKNLQQARIVIESLQLAELDNFFRSACLEPKQELDRLVDKEDQQAAVIYPILLKDRLDIILKLPNQKLQHFKTLISQDKVEATVASLREYLRDVTRTAKVKHNSQLIYNWLIRPLQAELTKNNIKTLVFVLDGELRNVPMAVLYDQQQQKYLMEKYAVVLTPGMQLIDPKPLQKVQLKVLTAGVGEERVIANRTFPRLENVPQELKAIQSQLPRNEELLNQRFTTNNLQSELKTTSFSVVHLATHGQFSSDPEKTFILTWNQLLNVKEFDNLMRISNQGQSNNNIELLVLSACKTAEGDKRAALGLAGVAVRAGARSTLATLWSVDDQSTAQLMSEFYRELKTGINKAEALQRAQLKVAAREKNPYFWAPFVLIGNWL